MKTIALSFVVVVLACVAARAQTDEFQRSEFFFGYSYSNPSVSFGTAAQTPYRERAGHDGFNGSAVVNVSRYFGIKGDISGVYSSDRFAFPVQTGIQSSPTITVVFNADARVYNFLGGVQVKDNAGERRLRLFAHALVGAAHRKNEIEGGPFPCIAIIPCPTNTSETGFASAFGGGLDIRIRKRFAIRPFQVDYNPIKFDARWDHNFRFSTGLVF